MYFIKNVHTGDALNNKDIKLFFELEEMEHCLFLDIRALNRFMLGIKKRLKELNEDFPDAPKYILRRLWTGNLNIFLCDEDGGCDEKLLVATVEIVSVKNIFRANENKLVKIEEKGGEA